VDGKVERTASLEEDDPGGLRERRFGTLETLCELRTAVSTPHVAPILVTITASDRHPESATLLYHGTGVLSKATSEAVEPIDPTKRGSG
jgi:hypothetical protein